MKVPFEIILEASPEQVWEKFDNTENLKLWQPTLVRFEHISGEPGRVGAVSSLTYEEDGREIVLTETITLRDRPREFAGVYESDSAINEIRNQFIDLGEGRTKWRMESEFEFRGIYRLMSIFMRGSIRKRTENDMQRFRRLVEGD